MKFWLLTAALVLTVQGCEPTSAEKAPKSDATAAAAHEFKSVPVKAAHDGPGIWASLGVTPAHADGASDAAPLDLASLNTSKIVDAIRAELEIPEGVDVRLDDIRPSMVPGLAQAKMILSKEGTSQSQTVFFSNDGRWLSAYSMYQMDAVVTSPLPGFHSLRLKSIGGQDEGETRDFHVSADGQLITLGEIWDTSVNPYMKRMSQLTLEGTAVRGKVGSKVVMVEFSDFQCPYCSRAADTVADRIYPEYKDRVEFRFKHLPLSFHDWATPAALASACVQEQDADKFWVAYDFFFDNQRAISRANIDQKVREMAQSAGVNAGKFSSCYEQNRFGPQIEKDMAEAASLGISGTPAFVINGRKLSGAQPYTAFKKILDEELAKVQ